MKAQSFDSRKRHFEDSQDFAGRDLVTRRKDRQGMAVRLEDVAADAGVSPITVSRALRSPELLSERMLKRVQDSIDRLGYVPNRVAGSLASARTQTVGLVVPAVSSPRLAEMMQGLNEVLTPAGYNILLGIDGLDPVREQQLVSGFLGQKVAGLFLHGTTHTRKTRNMLARDDVAVFELGDLVSRPLGSNFSYSNERAVRKMAQYLCTKYQRIALVALPEKGNRRSTARRKAFIEELSEAGRDPSQIVDVELHSGGGVSGLLRALELRPRPECILFAVEVMGAEALAECLRMGVKVPDEVAIAGIDDSLFSEILPPGLTTLRIPRLAIGRSAAEEFLQQMKHGRSRIIRDLGFELIVRGSA